jgi:hypothetical protein
MLDGMFTILVPAAVSPLFATVFWAERKAKRLGIVQSLQDPPEIAGASHLLSYGYLLSS